MKYGEFEEALLGAFADGQGSAFAAAASIDPNIDRQWVRDAVKALESAGYIDVVSWGISPERIIVRITGAGRRAAERIAEKAG